MEQVRMEWTKKMAEQLSGPITWLTDLLENEWPELLKGTAAARMIKQMEDEGLAIVTQVKETFVVIFPETTRPVAAIARREKLMPFFWGEWMRHHGSVAGNPQKGSSVRLANRLLFSYPGYSEILTGQARDDLITSNDKVLNPNPTVLEFLRRKMALPQKQVAAFASWDVIGVAVQHEAGAIFTNTGYETYTHPDPIIQSMSRLQFESLTPWDTVRHDEITFRLAMAHLKTHRPRVLYLSLGETDDWAHDKRYDRVLAAIARFDNFFKELWNWLQNEVQYRNNTTLLITTDHGRGNISLNWHSHNAKIKDAKNTWLAVISPDSPLRGEWTGGEPVIMDQIAATLCRFVGLDYSEQNPKAGKPIARIFRK